MSHLNPFHPAMACERQPFSKLPREAQAMIKVFSGPPSPTPTAVLMKHATLDWCRIVLPVRPHAHFTQDYNKFGDLVGFGKYLKGNFHRSRVADERCYTHKRLGHSFILDNSGYFLRMFDAAGNRCNYCDLEIPVQ